MAKLTGRWKLDRSEHFEDYMIALGVSIFIRKAVQLMPNPSCQIENPEDDMFIITMSVPIVMTHVQKFTIGEPFEDLVPNGDKQMTVVSRENEFKLVFEEKDVSQPPHVVSRELIDGEMVMLLQKGDVTCKRVFKRV